MVKLKALKDCKIAFMQNNEKKKFIFKENDIIEEENNIIIEKLLNTKLIIEIK